MFRSLVTTFLPILGILLCPFACMGTGMVTIPGLTTPSCGCECGAWECDDTLPSDGSPVDPDHDDCHHECVNNALVEHSGKTLVLTLGFACFVDGSFLSQLPDPPVLALRQNSFDRNATHPELASGIALRVTFASLLI